MMVSVLSQSPFSVLASQEPSSSKIQFNELGNLDDAVDSFTKLMLRSGRTSVRLYCTIPTWSATTDTCLDLHDLNELRSRLLLFIHDVLQSLRSSGIAASYSLTPSNSSSCLVYALPPDQGTSQLKLSDLEFLQKTCVDKRENVLLADLEHGPCLALS